jgi:hypothetical protein
MKFVRPMPREDDAPARQRIPVGCACLSPRCFCTDAGFLPGFMVFAIADVCGFRGGRFMLLCGPAPACSVRSCYSTRTH